MSEPQNINLEQREPSHRSQQLQQQEGHHLLRPLSPLTLHRQSQQLKQQEGRHLLRSLLTLRVNRKRHDRLA